MQIINHEQNIKILNKGSISITDFSFCLSSNMVQHGTIIMDPVFKNVDILFTMYFFH